jgi:hypothetical protein
MDAGIHLRSGEGKRRKAGARATGNGGRRGHGGWDKRDVSGFFVRPSPRSALHSSPPANPSGGLEKVPDAFFRAHSEAPRYSLGGADDGVGCAYCLVSARRSGLFKAS